MGQKLFLLVLLLTLVSGTLCAQGFLATVTGTVTDPSGAAVPGARVTVTNTSTNTKSPGVTNSAGLYVIPYLNPGPYEITVQAKGFRTLVRRGITLTVAERLKLNFALKVGAVHQTVTVSSRGSLLNTASVTSGQTISERSITSLPQADGNPYAFARLSPGVVYYGDRQFERLIDQDATSSIRINGAPGMSQFTLDGIPEGVSTGNVEPAQIHGTKHGMEHVAEDTNGSNGNFPAFVPPTDAVQEFQLTTSPFSAEYGHSAGGTMNVVLKGGTDKLHGDIYEFDRNTALFAHNFFEDASGQAKAPLHYNRYGGSIGGPVVIPRIYNGKNKTFFFFAGQGFGMSAPSPGLFTTPTAAERQGDFSALLAAGVKIYNPYSAVATNGLIERTPFAGNIITAADLPTAEDRAASQIGQNLLNVYPKQNLPCANKFCENNYYSPQTTTDHYNLEMARVDEVISTKDRITFNWYREMRRQVEDEWAGVVNGQLPAAKGLTRPVNGAGYEQTYELSPSTVLDARLGFSTRVETHFEPTAGTITPQSLGFPASAIGLFQGGNFLPYLEVDNLEDMPNVQGPDFQRTTVYSFDPTLMKTIGRQTLQFGYDFRVYRLG